MSDGNVDVKIGGYPLGESLGSYGKAEIGSCNGKSGGYISIKY